MTLKTADSYTALIPWQNADKPNYRAVVNGVVQSYVDQQALLASLPDAFDIDTAVGVQLDIVGQWVGPARRLPVPVQNIFFSFDKDGVGLDQGYWKGPYQLGHTIEALDDDTYRRLLLARIQANQGQATPESAQEILSAFFDAPPLYIGGFTGAVFGSAFGDAFDTGRRQVSTYVIVQDNTFVSTTQSFFAFDDPAAGLDGPAVWYQAQLVSASLPVLDPSLTIGFAGANPSVLDLEVFLQRLLPVVNAGVRSEVLISSVNGAPLFGFDIENEKIAGLDSGCWGLSPDDFIASRA